jgi:hypothetical protein
MTGTTTQPQENTMTTLNSPQTPHSAATAPQPATRRHSGAGWFVTGALALFGALVMLITGVAVQVIDDASRRDGYLTSDQIPITTAGHAVATQRLDFEDIAPLWPDIDRLLGEVRLRATGAGGKDIFIGVAPADQAATYLAGVRHATLTELADPATKYADHAGGSPAGRPADQNFWLSQASGPGTQAVEWPMRDGNYAVVVMNADGSAGVAAMVDAGATVPVQDAAAKLLLIGSVPPAVLGFVLILIGFRRRRSGMPS